MTKRMTGLSLLLFLTALGLLPVITAKAEVITDFDTCEVTLSIEKYCQVEIVDDITMTTITSSYLGTSGTSDGEAAINILSNFDATLKCPKEVILTRTGNGEELTVTAKTTLVPQDPLQPYFVEPYYYLDYVPGTYVGSTKVKTSITKVWDYEDVAGTYKGTLTLELYETP